VVNRQRAEEVEQFLASVLAWARQRRDVRAVALVGSWAYGRPRPDSDVDVVLLTEAPAKYIEGEDWLDGLGGTRLIKTQNWGPITERRFALKSGLEVELGVARPGWASVTPVDDGTRRVATDGMRTIYDPDGLLAKLEHACRRPQ
jgi:predicted nucleotidyltransferase